MTNYTTITLNPCIDRHIYFENPIRLGELNRTAKTLMCAGGKGINVSRELIKLKANVNTITFAGGESGKMFRNMLCREKINSCVLESAYETRTCTKLVDMFGTTDINEAGMLGENEIKLLVDAIADILFSTEQKQIVFLCGSIPQGVDKNVYNLLITLFYQCGIEVICDCEGEALKQALHASPKLIKPNKKELEGLAETSFSTEESLVEFCHSLYVDNETDVLCTLGESGAVYVGKEGIFTQKNKQIINKNSTGAGDTYLAAFVFAKENRYTIPDAMEFAANEAAYMINGR